ncbi:MAG TPA: hypothetical protein PK668_00460 [Myxococcota bacterium]|nr:hypothetical protein [Myxococcota bacterium]HRY95697.1 hypothetical protein [Myxococcota bacterium]HSA20187.1 hypothetical protein [Myxococcota bacterium]
MKVKICAGLVILALLGGGVHGLYLHSQNPNPLDMPCDRYVKDRPSAGWLRLTGCTLFIPEAIAEQDRKYPHGLIRLYLPVRVPTEPADAKTPLLLATRDPALIGLYQQLQARIAAVDEYKRDAFIEEHLAEMLVSRDVEGMIGGSLSPTGQVRQDIARIGQELSEDFVILSEGDRPDARFAMACLMAGMVGLGLGVRRLYTDRRSRKLVVPAIVGSSPGSQDSKGSDGFLPPQR